MFIERQPKLIQLRRITFDRLKQHNRDYNDNEDENITSFDDIIVRL
jgi:hypothetical protein